MALGFSKNEKADQKVDPLFNSDGTQDLDPENQAGRTEKQVAEDSDSTLSVGKQIELEANNSIKYRTCGWKKTAALLFSEYICLAIMSFPYSYSVLGLVPGLILTVVVAAFVLYTSLVLWEFCLRHPEIQDVCDLGQKLFWDHRAAYWFTAVLFVLNNTFIMGFHCLVGAKYLNTVSHHSTCTLVFSLIVAVISWLCSVPRTFSSLAKLATASAFFTFISVMLAAIFAAVEDHPAGYPSKGKPLVLIVPTTGTTFVAGVNAFMNISYTFIGQITLPSFIAEMREPKDFPKALWAVTIAEVILFSLVGGLVYGYTGTNYNTAPAFGSLGNKTFMMVSFSFMIPTIIFLGVLYAAVTARWLFRRIFRSRPYHIGNHTVIGWASWCGILAVLWAFAFIVAEVIPFFSDLLSLMSGLFDSFFGFIFWAVAYFRMRSADHGRQFWKIRGMRGYLGFALNIFIVLVGLFFLTGGTYGAIMSIKHGYETAGFGGAFTCANNGF